MSHNSVPLAQGAAFLVMRRHIALIIGVIFWLVLVACLGIPSARAADSDEAETEEPASDEDEKLPTLDKMELPSFEKLLKGPAVDWVVMHSKKVIEVEPVQPRPGTLEFIDQRVKKALRKSSDPPDSDDARERRMALYYLPVTLLEGEDRDYKLHVKYIKEIIYHEEQMLRRIDLLLDDRHVRQAYELLTALEDRQQSWPGVKSRKDRLLFTESVVRFDERQPQHALALLEALHERNPAYTGLEDQFGIVTDRLVTEAINNRDPRAARYFLRRLARRYPNHKVAKAGADKLLRQTRELLVKVADANRDGQLSLALDLAEEASRTWPELSDLLPVYNRLANRLQRLRVGVVDLPDPGDEDAAVLLSPARKRRRQLTRTLLFDPARLNKESKIVRYETKFFNEWDPTELGHSVLFHLRPWRTAGQSQPSLTAASLFETLRRRLEPVNREYDARFAAAIESLEIRSPFELLARFRQVPLRPEALFAFPLRLEERGRQSEFETPPEKPLNEQAGPSTTWPFELSVVDDQRAVYRRTVAEPDGSSNFHVSEIIETRYPTEEKAVQGLLRGEISFLPRVPVARVKALSARPEFFVQNYALPTTHVLQFNPHCRALSARTLRRALVYALDRRRILEEVFLHEPAGPLGRQISAPFATTSYAYNRLVEPHKFDPALAFSLAKTAEKELAGKIPVLKLRCSSQPEVQQAAARIVEQWVAIGIEVELAVAPAVALSENNSDDWDILYRTETLAEPLIELWQFLALTASTETSALGHLPTWLRQELLDLDRVGNWKVAGRLLQRLHEQFWAEVHLIPLWEIDDVMVYRRNIRGVPDQPVNLYQKIEQWKVEPWYSREPPL